MKKIRALAMFAVLPIIIILFISANVLAGDIPESIIRNHEVDVIIGTVFGADEDRVTVLVSDSLFGLVTENVIEVRGFKYLTDSGLSGSTENTPPELGEYCVFAATVKDGDYAVYESLCARANSFDPKTLKLEGSNEFIKTMNKYINEGLYSKENRDRMSDGEIEATPANDPLTSGNTGNPSMLLIIIGGVLIVLIILFIVIFKFKKRTH